MEAINVGGDVYLEDMASDSISIPVLWSYSSERELLDLYLDGMDLDFLACHFDIDSREIVVKLAELFFEIDHPSQNPSARNYRKPWNWGDNSKLWRMYAVGVPIATIAKKLGRDELGICYRILSEQYVIVPRAIVERYKLDQDNFAIESDSRFKVKTCPNCLDVVVYCKCRIE